MPMKCIAHIPTPIAVAPAASQSPLARLFSAAAILAGNFERCVSDKRGHQHRQNHQRGIIAARKGEGAVVTGVEELKMVHVVLPLLLRTHLVYTQLTNPDARLFLT